MTDTLSRPTRAQAAASRAPRSPLRAGSLAAGRAVGWGLGAVGVLVLIGWAADSRVDAGAVEALRAAGQVWLALHGATLELPDGRLGLTPLGLAAFPVVLLVRAGARAARQSDGRTRRDITAVALGVAVPYAAIATAVAVLSAGPDVRVDAGGALAATLVLASVCSTAGAVRGAGSGRALWTAVPEPGRTVLLAAVGALAVLLAGGALLAGTALAVHGGQAAELARAGAPGPVGGAALLVVGLGLVPNAAVWGASWLAGPGFAVGAGTAVSPTAFELGPLPALPLLAALPGGPAPGWVAVLAYAVPLAAGALAGWVVCRRTLPAGLPGPAGVRGPAGQPGPAGLPGTGPLRTAVRAAAAGPVAGLGLALLAALSGGPAGGQRLTVVGPSAGQVGLAVTLTVGVGAAATAGLLRRRGG